MRNFLTIALILLFTLALSAEDRQPQAPAEKPSAKVAAVPYTPTSDYTKKEIEGWSVYVNNALVKEEALAGKVLRLLEVKLYDIKRMVPAEGVKEVQKINIWIELRDKRHPCACYHPDVGWLKANGFNPDKAKGVEISNAATFLEWTKQQPWMILHELAHGYHDRVLGNDHPEVLKAYKDAVASKKYDSVLRWNGKMDRHYALTNQMEYFAEATEAYYGTNDFYPFVRSELRQHDPAIHDMMEKLWKSAAAK